MEAKYLVAHQRTIIATVLMAYYGNDDNMEIVNSIELKEEYFYGYHKSMVRAINILREKNPIVNDEMVEDFLINKNHLNEREFIEILGTQYCPLSVLEWHIDKLQGEYTKRLLR